MDALQIMASDGGTDESWGLGELNNKAVTWVSHGGETAWYCHADEGVHFVSWNGACFVVRGGRVVDCDMDCDGVDTVTSWPDFNSPTAPIKQDEP